MQKTSSQKLFVVGGGSIGRRHLKNLKSLGETSLLLYEANAERAAQAAQETGASLVNSLDAGFAERPTAVLICTPNHLHVPIALQAAHHDCAIFVEKPISNSLDGLNELLEEVKRRHLVGYVGFNLRFHPGLRRAKEILERGKLGKLFSCRVNAGQYLPDWHPWEDFRKGYSANRSMGGGILLDTHEFDYLGWLAGTPKELSCFTGKVSQLEIDTEDVAEVNFWLEGGVLANLHVDYLQRAYQRRYEFYGELGTLVWDSQEGLKLYEATQKKWIEFPDLKTVDPNFSYLEEMKHFLACLRGEEVPQVTLQRGKEVLEWVLAAKESAASGNRVVLPSHEGAAT